MRREMINEISVNKTLRGGVYYIDFHDERKSRPCLIVSEAIHYGENILAMAITTKESVPNLLPILLNGKISFIRTSGIFEITESEIHSKKYLGRVSDTVFSLALAMFSLRFGSDEDTFKAVKTAYSEYSKVFSKMKLKETEVDFKFDDNCSTVVESIDIKNKEKEKYPYSLSDWTDKQLRSFRHDSFSMPTNELKEKYQCDDRRLAYLQRYVKNELYVRKKKSNKNN